MRSFSISAVRNSLVKVERSILSRLDLTTREETELICFAVYNHSDKHLVHSKFDEILKDADVLQHNLYNTKFPIIDKERSRFKSLLVEFEVRGEL